MFVASLDITGVALRLRSNDPITLVKLRYKSYVLLMKDFNCSEKAKCACIKSRVR